ILAATGNLISTFGEDEAGELYYASLGFSTTDGAVYRISVPPALPFSDDFSDGDASDWRHTKGTWTVVNQALQGSTNKKADNFAPFSGCSNCTIEADLQVDAANGRFSLLGWYRSKSDYVELMFMADRDRVILKQRFGGTVAAKQKVNFTIDPAVNYHAKVSFDGTQFQVFLNGDTNPIITLRAAGLALGGAGFRAKSTSHSTVTGTFDSLSIY
ncbi:MAG TPA: hypothetical protein VLR94_01920, partial [Acidobacteriota bacterium]|nr:hypothetical protein [Acidobacteriota bacterium]